MSLQAMVWALGLGPDRLGDVAPAAHVTLMALANCADAQGRNSWPSAETLAEQRKVSVRTIRRHLQQLEEAGLIVRGDQALVRHLPANRRPVVWDMGLKPVDNSDSRGDTDVTPEGLWGDTQRHSGVTSDVTQTVLEPYVSSTYSRPGTRGVSTGEDDKTDFPDRDCIHGHSALWYHDKRKMARLPMCPFCRKSGKITLAPLEVANA